MAILFEGNCMGRPVDVEFGMDNNNKPRVRWSMEVVDGPHAGKRASYSGKLDPDNIKFTKRDMMSIGWQGKDVRTFVDDTKKANRVVPFVAEIASFERDGRLNQWTSAKMTGAAPLTAPDNAKVDDVNRWFAEVGDAPAPGGGDNGIPF